MNPELPMNAIILCGGLSTRLGEITKQIPKILLEIGPHSVLDWQIMQLKAAGVRRVVLAAGHLAQVLEANAGNMRYGVELLYAVEPKKLGTGGAIKHSLKYVPEPAEPTFILNGDILTTIDFQDMAAQLQPLSQGIILGTRVDDASALGTLDFDVDKKLLAFKEKEGKAVSAVINGGMYLFTPAASALFPDEDVFSIEYEVFPHMKELYVYVSDKPWIDIGVPERLAWARENWQTIMSHSL